VQSRMVWGMWGDGGMAPIEHGVVLGNPVLLQRLLHVGVHSKIHMGACK
jgi:hypothetical protein